MLLFQGCTNLSTPEGVERWIDNRLPMDFKCSPRVALAGAQLRDHGYKTFVEYFKYGEKAHVRLRWEKDGETGYILDNSQTRGRTYEDQEP